MLGIEGAQFQPLGGLAMQDFRHHLAFAGPDDDAVTSPHLRARLMQLVLNIDDFADAAPTLQRLKQAGLRTAILSNGTATMLASGSIDAYQGTGIWKPPALRFACSCSQIGSTLASW